MLVWLGLLGPTSSIIRDAFQSVWIANILCSVHNLWFLTLTCRAHTKGVMQPHATLRRVLRKFFKASAFLEGFLEGAL